MKVSLVVMNAGKATGQTIPVTLAQFIIGRDPQCNLRPASAVISKRHCALLVKNDQVTVRDFESTNGTFVNEKPVKGEVPLNHEDILKVGPLAFRVVIEKTPPVNKPTPPPGVSKIASAKAGSPGNEEDVAAMLLSLQEEGSGDGIQAADEESDIPGGSTVMDMVPLTNVETKADQPAHPAPAKSAAATPAKPQAGPAAKAATAPPARAPAPAKPTPAKPHTPAAVTPPPSHHAPAAAAPVPQPEPAAPAAQAAPDAPAAEAAPAPAQMAPRESVPKTPHKAPEKKPPQNSASSARDAARAILEKYVKRNRG